jgi:hypothetical protein
VGVMLGDVCGIVFIFCLSVVALRAIYGRGL